MGLAMQTVRVRDKHQITLPMSIVRAAHIRENDRLLVNYKNGAITLLTETHEAPKSMRDYIGIVKGAYGATGEAVNGYFDQAKESWGH
jgi:bifunctional DNA-binding transcriptional regulator/antitoxin component of YhaV-PrlF toxin-antitoxin module